jgi:hypothetical protein
MKAVHVRIRPSVDSDLAGIVELSLLAWEPVFESFEKVLGPRIFSILYPDWRKSQAEGVEGAYRATDKYHTLVAELDGRVAGFIAYELKGETGEVILLAVHPECDDLSMHISMIGNWEEQGFRHYLDWFYTKWTGKPAPRGVATGKVLEFQERLAKSGFWWPAA